MNSELKIINDELDEKESILGITEDSAIIKYVFKPFVNYGIKPIGNFIVKPITYGCKKFLNGASTLCGTTSVFVIHEA